MLGGVVGEANDRGQLARPRCWRASEASGEKGHEGSECKGEEYVLFHRIVYRQLVCKLAFNNCAQSPR